MRFLSFLLASFLKRGNNPSLFSSALTEGAQDLQREMGEKSKNKK